MRRIIPYLFLLFVCFSSAGREVSVRQTVQTALVDAVRMYSDGDLDSALGIFRKLHRLDRGDDAVLYYLSLSEYAKGQLDSAFVHMEKAVEADTTNLWYIYSLATMCAEKGDASRAASLMGPLLEKRPQSFANPFTLTLMGDTSLNSYKDSLALSYYERALDYDPGYVPALLGRTEIQRMRGNMPAFFVGLEDLVSSSGTPVDVKRSYLGAITERMDSKFYWVWGKKMTELVDKSVEMHPDDAGLHYLKLQYCSISRDTLGIIAQCEEMIRCSENDKENKVKALGILGDTYYARGDRKLAYRTYDAALKVDPEYIPVLNNYAYFLCEEGSKLKKALKMSAVTVEKEPDNPTYLDTYGWLLYLLKKPAKAKPYFKHAMIYGGKNSAVVLYHYSKVLEALGEKDLADYYKMLSENR